MMPRPAIGQAAKSEIVTVRLTKREVKELERQYGSAGKGLRALLTASKVHAAVSRKVEK
jgi:hypothetical protein